MAAQHVVDITAVALVKAHHAQRGAFTHRDVHKALSAITHVTTLGLTAIDCVAAREFAYFGLIGHDANRTGLGIRAKGRALWSGEHFNSVDVINMRVEVGANQRHGLLVQIDRNRRVGSK